MSQKKYWTDRRAKNEHWFDVAGTFYQCDRSKVQKKSTMGSQMDTSLSGWR
jgi:hypothetical protein